jgi:hypothetical protein
MASRVCAPMDLKTINRRRLILGLGAVALTGCSKKPAPPLETHLRQLQRGDRWAYRRNILTQNTEVVVEVSEVRELGQGVRDILLKMNWEVEIKETIRDPLGRDRIYTTGTRAATQTQRLSQGSDGTILWREVVPSEQRAQDLPMIGIEPLFLSLGGTLGVNAPLPQGAFDVPQIGDRKPRLRSYAIVGIETIDISLGRFQAFHVVGKDTFDGLGGKPATTTFDDWYDGTHFLLRRQFREDTGEKVIGINLAFSGSWELMEFQSARK